MSIENECLLRRTLVEQEDETVRCRILIEQNLQGVQTFFLNSNGIDQVS